jgi:DNA mismatch endonuclease (patch repair protein)
MRAVHSRSNKSTEILVGQILWNHDIRGYRKHWPVMGKPDFCWPGRKIALFVDGCFWHGCPRCGKSPSTHRSYWSAKIKKNRLRDGLVKRTLQQEGWRVFRVWECQIKANRFLYPLSLALIERR